MPAKINTGIISETLREEARRRRLFRLLDFEGKFQRQAGAVEPGTHCIVRVSCYPRQGIAVEVRPQGAIAPVSQQGDRDRAPGRAPAGTVTEDH